MAYIVPNSLCYLLKNVPLSPNYEHTWFFNNGDIQRDKFLQYSPVELRMTDSQYIRATDNYITVPFTMEEVLLCNYMMFGNISFEHKWFYAFIDRAEYVSNNVTRLYYHIDVMQTWITNYNFHQCLIVRQHATTDVPGDNLQPEGLETGEYIIQRDEYPRAFETMLVLVAHTWAKSGTDYVPARGTMYFNTFSGVQYSTFRTDQQGIDALNGFLSDMQQNGPDDAIVSITMIPEFSVYSPITPYVTMEKPSTLGSYVPRNKKLLTSPYSFMYVTNMQGLAAQFPWEYFSSTPSFYFQCYPTTSPEIIIWPNNYKGMSNNYDELMLVSGFPQCAFSTDAFKAWLAQTGGSFLASGVSLATDLNPGSYSDTEKYMADYFQTREKLDAAVQAQATGGGTSHTGSGSVASLRSQAIKQQGLAFLTAMKATPSDWIEKIGQKLQRFIKPPHAVGNTNVTTLFNQHLIGFRFMEKHITTEYAAIIDGYFDKFGYAQNKFGIPNRTARKSWTYIQTKGCTIYGEVPADTAVEIEQIYDSGITFWDPNKIMGDYSQDNSL